MMMAQHYSSDVSAHFGIDRHLAQCFYSPHLPNRLIFNNTLDATKLTQGILSLAPLDSGKQSVVMTGLAYA